jgi:O-antigen/teichoic acid export membrane protein
VPLGLATIAYEWHGFWRRYLFARERAVMALCNDLLRFCIQLSALIALPTLSVEPQSAAGIWIVGGACAVSAVPGVVLFGRLEWNSATFFRVLARHWIFSKWLLPSAIMYWMTSQVFYLMSGSILGAGMAGKLRAALVITLALNVLLQALDNFAPSQAAWAMHRGGRAELSRYVKRLAVLLTILMGAIVAILNIDPEFLVRLIYGEDYEGIAFMIPWLSAVGVLHGFNMVLCVWAAAMERTSLIFRAYAITTCCTVVLAYPMTAYGGVAGVLLGLVLAEAVKLIMLWTSIKGVRNQRVE